MTGRKNWLFSDTPNGSNASALVYSIVETAKANNTDIYYYLKYLLPQNPTTKTPDEELEKLCPWHPKCQETIKRMQEEHKRAIFDAM